MATDGSLALWFVTFLVSCAAAILVASAITEINNVIVGGLALILWPLIFPSIVKAKKFKQRKYWLPKNRLLGYFVYFIVPISVIVLALAAAIYFEVGM